MSWLDRFRRRDRDLADEFEAHFQMAIADRMAGGASRADAEAAAKREFGNRLLVTETVRDVWGRTWLESLWGDMRYGWRSLWSRPGFAAMATLALAIGIGAATTMFSVLYGVLIDPFPYKDASRLVLLSVFDQDKRGEEGEPGERKHSNSIRESILFGYMRLTVREAHQLAWRAMAGLGHDASESELIADHLIDCELRGLQYGGLARAISIAERFERTGNHRRPIRMRIFGSRPTARTTASRSGSVCASSRMRVIIRML